MGALGGIGFTVSLFITDLAFTDPLLLDAAKVGIFLSSILSGLLGTVFFCAGAGPGPGRNGLTQPGGSTGLARFTISGSSGVKGIFGSMVSGIPSVAASTSREMAGSRSPVADVPSGCAGQRKRGSGSRPDRCPRW